MLRGELLLECEVILRFPPGDAEHGDLHPLEVRSHVTQHRLVGLCHHLRVVAESNKACDISLMDLRISSNKELQPTNSYLLGLDPSNQPATINQHRMGYFHYSPHRNSQCSPTSPIHHAEHLRVVSLCHCTCFVAPGVLHQQTSTSHLRHLRIVGKRRTQSAFCQGPKAIRNLQVMSN